jgi:mono/diheme cytochrome c family protein
VEVQRFVGKVTALAAGVLLAAGSAWAAQDVAAIYKRQCASCHGADGSGKTGPGKAFKLRDLRSPEVQKLSDTQLFDILNKGVGKMPGYSHLGHDTLHGLVDFMRNLAKKDAKSGEKKDAPKQKK